MLVFFLLAAVLVIAVLAFMLPAMVRNRAASAPDRNEINLAIVKEQLAEVENRLQRGEIGDQEWRDERLRLERDLAIALQNEGSSSDRGQWLIWPLAASVPIAAGAIYIALGTPVAIQLPMQSPIQSPHPVVNNTPQQEQAPDMRVVIERIQERVAQQPEDAEAWFMLGRAYMNTGEFDNASQAIRRSLELDPDNVDVMVRLADALAMSRNGQMLGEPTELLERALKVAPRHPQALWLLGLAQREQGALNDAIASWETLLTLLESDPASQQDVRQLIARARAELQGSAATDTAASGAEPAGTSLTVSVESGIDLNEIDPGTTVFVYARAMQGPPMPLAVVRRTVADLPFTVTLTEGDAMVAGMGLGTVDQLIVGARIARSGQAIAKTGDVMGEVQGIDHRDGRQVSISISDIVP